ncbi:TPA: type II toxin-antitoxin system VapC family toxin [Candidatus Bathyarchaeota archaeon]|nr:type II toxin-antitoxin system VapC family toxin [Candidatus Bathyarchaeota archaeon]
MKTYVSDAVTFIYFLFDRLPREADEAFKRAEEGDAVIYLPTIAAAELYYLFEKKGWHEYWAKLKKEISKSAMFRYYPFNERILNLFHATKAKEIHDKIIVLTAKILKADALITKDENIRKLKEIKTIWS